MVLCLTEEKLQGGESAEKKNKVIIISLQAIHMKFSHGLIYFLSLR